MIFIVIVIVCALPIPAVFGTPGYRQDVDQYFKTKLTVKGRSVACGAVYKINTGERYFFSNNGIIGFNTEGAIDSGPMLPNTDLPPTYIRPQQSEEEKTTPSSLVIEETTFPQHHDEETTNLNPESTPDDNMKSETPRPKRTMNVGGGGNFGSNFDPFYNQMNSNLNPVRSFESNPYLMRNSRSYFPVPDNYPNFDRDRILELQQMDDSNFEDDFYRRKTLYPSYTVDTTSGKYGTMQKSEPFIPSPLRNNNRMDTRFPQLSHHNAVSHILPGNVNVMPPQSHMIFHNKEDTRNYMRQTQLSRMAHSNPTLPGFSKPKYPPAPRKKTVSTNSMKKQMPNYRNMHLQKTRPLSKVYLNGRVNSQQKQSALRGAEYFDDFAQSRLAHPTLISNHITDNTHKLTNSTFHKDKDHITMSNIYERAHYPPAPRAVNVTGISTSKKRFFVKRSLLLNHKSKTTAGPVLCTWKFTSDSSCKIMTARFIRYKQGDIRCDKQYLLFKGESNMNKFCSGNEIRGIFESNGKQLTVEHFRQAGVVSSEYEGYVSCQ